MDGRQDSGRRDGCPRWCAGEHDELSPPRERLHRSPARSLPVVLWSDPSVEREPAAADVHVSLCRPGGDGEVRLRLESDGLGALDLDPSSAARLSSGIASVLALLGAAP